MASQKILTSALIDDINRVGTAIFARWFTENGITLGSKGNLFDILEEALQNDTISLLHIKQAIAELEESGNKKIILLNVPNATTVEEERSSLLSKWKRSFGLSLSSDDWVTGTASITPAVINLVWHDNVIKIKYVERQFEIIVDPEADTVQRVPRTVCAVLIVDTTDGLAQIRLDTPYQLHSHRNDENKPTDKAYEQFYRDKLAELFEGVTFADMDLRGVTKHIVGHLKDSFRINKGLSTISGGNKQMFSTVTLKGDIRDIPEYKGAAKGNDDVWMAEELTGYWLAKSSGSELTRDLFMRISRKESAIRVQRGCLAKELAYGVQQIREIQKSI